MTGVATVGRSLVTVPLVDPHVNMLAFHGTNKL